MRNEPAEIRTKVIPIVFLTSRTPEELLVPGPLLLSGPPAAVRMAAALAAAAAASNVLPREVAAFGVENIAEPGFRSEISFDPSAPPPSGAATVTWFNCSTSAAAFL